jgi:hypothetical protein
MGYSRHFHVPPNTPGTYHCVSRCVRRAFLCGHDAGTGRSFEHRRQWIEDRVVQLAQVFAVAGHGYALMSNHFHLVVEIDPGAPQQWNDEEVARRWLALSAKASDTDATLPTRIAQLAELRECLGSLSWFMKYLKEPIARRANREDACKGCFWEAGFRSQALLDDTSILSSLVYVDLNPVGVGIAHDLSVGVSCEIIVACPESLLAVSTGPFTSSPAREVQSVTVMGRRLTLYRSRPCRAAYCRRVIARSPDSHRQQFPHRTSSISRSRRDRA